MYTACEVYRKICLLGRLLHLELHLRYPVRPAYAQTRRASDPLNVQLRIHGWPAYILVVWLSCSRSRVRCTVFSTSATAETSSRMVNILSAGVYLSSFLKVRINSRFYTVRHPDQPPRTCFACLDHTHLRLSACRSPHMAWNMAFLQHIQRMQYLSACTWLRYICKAAHQKKYVA